MSHKIRAALALAMTALLLVPSATAGSTYTGSRTSNACWAVWGTSTKIPGPIPCSITLTVALTGHGCDDTACSYTLNMTATGTVALPGWLEVDSNFYLGDGVGVCTLGGYPERNLTQDYLPCDGRACQYGVVGTRVSCPSHHEVAQYVEPGGCSLLALTAHVWAVGGLESDFAGYFLGVCHAPDGSVDFRQWDSG